MTEGNFNLQGILSELSNPILIGGKVLEYYGLRKGHDYDFVVSKKDFEKLKKKYGEFDFPKNTPGVKLYNPKTEFEIDLFVSMYGKNYNHLLKNSTKSPKYLMASLHDIMEMKMKTYFDKVRNATKNKSLRDVKLILSKI